MNKLYIVLILLALSACKPSNNVEPEKSADRLVCEGKLIEMSDYLIVINCLDGRVVMFKSHRSGLERAIVQTK